VRARCDRGAIQCPGRTLQVIAGEERALVERIEAAQLIRVVRPARQSAFEMAERRAGQA